VNALIGVTVACSIIFTILLVGIGVVHMLGVRVKSVGSCRHAWRVYGDYAEADALGSYYFECSKCGASGGTMGLHAWSDIKPSKELECLPNRNDFTCG